MIILQSSAPTSAAQLDRCPCGGTISVDSEPLYGRTFERCTRCGVRPIVPQSAFRHPTVQRQFDTPVDAEMLAFRAMAESERIELAQARAAAQAKPEKVRANAARPIVWRHEDGRLFTGSVGALMVAFPRELLDRSALSRVRRRTARMHRGWAVAGGAE